MVHYLIWTESVYLLFPATCGHIDDMLSECLQLASKYAFSALLVDIVALIALWLAVAVVGAIDSIPVVSVGVLSYDTKIIDWFVVIMVLY